LSWWGDLYLARWIWLIFLGHLRKGARCGQSYA
jgi:hypothetical protein